MTRAVKLMATLALAGLCVIVLAGPVSAAEKEEAAKNVRYGGDIRIREERFDDLPIKADPPGVTRGGENDYFRFRTRLWSELDPMQNVTLRVRAVNEFRAWDKPDASPALQRSNYDFPDEVVFDALSFEVKNLLNDKLDLKVGRQDMIYGTGKVILEGTPKDGSRTIYFNAAKAVFRASDKTTVDLFGIHNRSLDELAINSADRDLTGFTSANDDMTEQGVGLYLQNKSNESLPLEAYLIYKREGAWNQAARKDEAGAYIAPTLGWQELDSGRGVVKNSELNLGTAGLRLMPVFTENLKGNLEVAYQMGERGDSDVQGHMLDASLIQALPLLGEMKPTVNYGVYYLSGDDPASKDDTGWNPLWARYPQYSELYVYCWDAEAAGRWSNLTMPNVGLSLKPMPWLKTSAMVAYLRANEKDGPGGGAERGWLGVIKGEFEIKQKLFCQRDKLSAHLWLEVLEPGNYYKVEDTAYFARWELMYQF
ncbi:MAG: hypothetical protein BWY59_01941 [Verrucomicrobia bacterium ADurb.Bin345]|nr:MAG: hypothetical protein BWY59_01941 [Verrucomicrobia bacterium ADurb.Bin345]